jgi:hypothetical protein
MTEYSSTGIPRFLFFFPFSKFRHFTQGSDYQIIFNPNCTCLDAVAVWSIKPAPGTGAPVESNRVLLSTGEAKFE